MSKKIVIVGGVAGGASTAARIRRLDEQASIIMFERGPHVSFSNCALPFHLSGIIEKSEKLVLMNPKSLKARYNIDARTHSEVIAINKERKTVTVRHVMTDELYEESYDKLVLSPGAKPNIPAITGVERDHVFTVRNVTDIERLQQMIVTQDAQHIAVIGGGYIGVEVAENLKLAGRHVTLIEHGKQVLKSFDFGMAQILQKEMLDKGVEVIVNDGLADISEDEVRLGSGKKVKASIVVLAIGVKPEIKLAQEAGLEIGALGGIKVDQNYMTSNQHIYAVGDAIEVYHRLLQRPVRLALAGPAQKQARKVADHIYGMASQHRGVIGSSSIHVFDLNAASTGLTEQQAKEAGFTVESVYILAPDKVSIMPSSQVMHLKVVFEIPTGRILGGQAIGKGTVDKRVDVLATLIAMNGTIYDLQELELTYSPMFSTAKDLTNIAGLVAGNILAGRIRQVHVSDVRPLVEAGAYFIDVREEQELANGHVKGAYHLPLSQLRERMQEVPKDQPVYIYCRSAQRSYNAVRALMGTGFDNVYNVSGSFLGISLYEYFTDVTTGREPILTNYNFK